MSKGNAVKGDRATHSMVNPAFHASDCEDETYIYHKNPNSMDIPYYSDLYGLSSPPTEAELIALLGTPETAGEGFLAIVSSDTMYGTEEYLVWSNGSYWFYLAGTLAV